MALVGTLLALLGIDNTAKNLGVTLPSFLISTKKSPGWPASGDPQNCKWAHPFIPVWSPLTLYFILWYLLSEYRAPVCPQRSYLFGDTWSCSTSSWLIFFILKSICNFVILIDHTVILLCWSILYTQHLLHVCPSWERDPSSVAHLNVSSIFFPC